MKIEVRFRGLESSEFLREHAARRVHFQLGRFEHELASVVLRIEDLNGPKGGVDKQCLVTVRGARVGLIALDVERADAYEAVDAALERVALAVGRSLERARDVNRGPLAALRTSSTT